MKCECNDCAFKGNAMCEHRKLMDECANLSRQALEEDATAGELRIQIANLKLLLAINTQFLADIAGTLYDNDLHDEEDSVLEMIRMNKGL